VRELSPAVISKLPIGLLGFFGIKNGGQYPQSIVAAIQPTLELGPILAANYNEMLAVSPIAALGFVTGNFVASGLAAVVPASELWWVSSISLQAFTGAGDSMTGAAEIRNTQTGSASVWHRAVSPEFTQGANLTRTLPCALDTTGFWAQPGDTFGFWYSAVTNASGNAQTSLQLRVTRFPA
jgi:hypothetical protein